MGEVRHAETKLIATEPTAKPYVFRVGLYNNDFCFIITSDMLNYYSFMFEFIKLIGSPKRELLLDTRQGNPIKNEIALPPSDLSLEREQLLFKRYGVRWQVRCQPSGIYNCAGHVWASRRTAIYEELEWTKILTEDEYRKLNMTEIPKPGDLALYHSEDVGFIHCGQVISIEPGLTAGGSPIPKILSKWDDASGEYIHFASDVPFKDKIPDFKLEYWTDRR